MTIDRNFKEKLSWDEKAKINPLFSVMSSDEFINKSPDSSKWSKNDLKLFFDKGKLLYESFVKPVLIRANLDRKKALIVEYGSGMGRILKFVKKDGFKCVGIDISLEMIKNSRTLNPEIRRLYTLDNQG